MAFFVFAAEWRLTSQQFDDQNADAPPIDVQVVSLLVLADDLGGLKLNFAF